MSNINTSSINITYPTPGVNNSTQGFRDNFSNIKLALDTTKTELNDLQSKVVLKSALTGTSINNDMANTIVSNCVTKTFRASTYDLGSNLTGQIVIDTTKGDVQLGTITDDVQFDFSKWAPSGTEAQVKLKLKIGTPTANIMFPNSKIDGATGLVSTGPTNSIRILENYASNNYPHISEDGADFLCTNGVTVPYGVTELNYTITTTDCGTTIDVTPTNRGTTASTIEVRSGMSAIGVQGDTAGHVCTDGNYIYVCVAEYDGTTHVWKRSALSSF